jgi:hypothetical protein
LARSAACPLWWLVAVRSRTCVLEPVPAEPFLLGTLMWQKTAACSQVSRCSRVLLVADCSAVQLLSRTNGATCGSHQYYQLMAQVVPVGTTSYLHYRLEQLWPVPAIILRVQPAALTYLQLGPQRSMFTQSSPFTTLVAFRCRNIRFEQIEQFSPRLPTQSGS